MEMRSLVVEHTAAYTFLLSLIIPATHHRRSRHSGFLHVMI